MPSSAQSAAARSAPACPCPCAWATSAAPSSAAARVEREPISSASGSASRLRDLATRALARFEERLADETGFELHGPARAQPRLDAVDVGPRIDALAEPEPRG